MTPDGPAVVTLGRLDLHHLWAILGALELPYRRVRLEQHEDRSVRLVVVGIDETVIAERRL